METKKNCNPNPPSHSADEAPNAFKPEFLTKLYDREDAPLAALEAELRGPWKVVEIPAVGCGRPPLRRRSLGGDADLGRPQGRSPGGHLPLP